MNRIAYHDLLFMREFTDLEPTAALVMIWARDLYRTGSAARFYSRLDLTSGERMRLECETICPWYEQVTLNRKWFIQNLIMEFITDADAPCQIIVPAAGKSPLALELLDACNDRIVSVIEIDIVGMAEKQSLYELTAPVHARKIRCIPADLFDLQGTCSAIHDTGTYDPGHPTVVIAEGISYYIPPAVLSGILSLFSSTDMMNQVILDYMVPCRLVREERRRFPRGIWRIINRDCNPGGTSTYSPDEMAHLLASAGCSHVEQHAMHNIEQYRTGTNQYFPEISDGWIQIAAGRL